jgi:hypothetical protein
MANTSRPRPHRTWQDWTGIALGIVIGLAPWLIDETGSRAAVINAAVAGVVVLALAELELVKLRRWPEIGLMLAGLWVALSPLVLGYAGAGHLRYWHFLAGAGVVGLAGLELWQDWRLGDDELARRER